ncbi:MAG TPA: ABC transporter [Actinomycetota bacterium]|nr:ABC transporter [Actinomycetota bacterium]
MTDAHAADLVAALGSLRASVAGCRLELDLGGAPEARRARDQLVGQLDDYLLPRLRDLEAPMLAVVGGSTGAGKSTIVNSLVGDEVSPAGVLRPTTRAPVLVFPPGEESWWRSERVLPGLARTSGGAPTGDAAVLHLVPHDSVPSGIGVLDAPDIDSVVAANRELATQLLAAADLWVFVTTAARYSDAVPWGFLRIARARATALALVLNRVPSEALDEVPRHLAELLRAAGLGDATLFTVRETELARGRVPDDELDPLREWLWGLASNAAERARVVRKTLEGALDSLDERVSLVASHVDAQRDGALALEAAARRAYDAARDRIEEDLSGGSLLRGEVLARWHEVIGTGELMRSLESTIGMVRDRVRAFLLGEAEPGTEVRATLGSSVAQVASAAADRAAEQAARAWADTPGGAALLQRAGGGLERSSPGLEARLDEDVRAWQGRVLELVREEGASKRAVGRALSLGVNAIGAAVMVTVFAHTGGLTGAEIAVAGGTATVSQKLLEALFGDQAVRDLTARARADLLDRLAALLAAELDRFTSLAAAAAPSAGEAEGLRGVAEAVRAARG